MLTPSHSHISSKSRNSFILDINSIMDELMDSDLDIEDEEEKKKKKAGPAVTTPTSKEKEKVTNSPAPKATDPSKSSKRSLETVTSTKRFLREEHVTTTAPSKHKDSSSVDKSPPLVDKPPPSADKPPPYQSPNRTNKYRNVPSDPVKTKSDENHSKPLSENHMKHEDREIRSPPVPKVKSDVKGHGVTETPKEIDYEEGARSRGRANALTSRRSDSVSIKTDSKPTGPSKETDQSSPNEKGVSEASPKSKSGSKEEARVKRSGSLSIGRAMSGDQALGIFYHNRRSQLTEMDSVDEGDKKTGDFFPERSASCSSPRSPNSRMSPLLRGKQDSGAVSPQGGVSVFHMPQSPLLKKSDSIDTGTSEGSGLQVQEEMKKGGSAESAGPPLSPRIVVNHDTDNVDVSQAM